VPGKGLGYSKIGMAKYNIIYIEDNPTDYEMVKAILEEKDLLKEMVRVEKKEELIKAMDSFVFDIVLTDYSLPVFHGLEAMRIVIEKFPEKPIIMITGNLPDEIAVDVIKQGAWDYVLKENVYRLVPSIKAVMERVQMIKEKAQTLEALKEQEENYRILAESSPYGIVVHSKGKVLYHNKKAAEIFAEREGFLGIDLAEYLHPEYKDVVLSRMEKLYAGKEVSEPVELIYYNSNKKEVMIEIASSPIFYNKVPAAQVIFHDISERKRMELELIKAKEQAEESDKLKTAFLENLSHEIRTPLNGMIGFVSLLKFKGIDESEKINYLDLIEESGNHLLSIIDDLIEISKIEAGQTDIRQSEFNLNELINDIFNFYNEMPKYQDSEIILGSVKGLTDKEAFVVSDKSRITQVFYNLLSNAFKFTASGRIDFGYTFVKKDRIRFFVKDTGIGIPSGSEEIIFERFRQLDVSTTRQYGGTGLGLTISRAIVEALRGRIWYESVSDQGSEFFFELKLKRISKTTEPEPEKTEENIECNWSSKKVLVAEDEFSNFVLIKHILKQTDIQITHVENGLEALKELEGKNSFDIVLLDIKMPVMDGEETIKKIREKEMDIPVIAQTAYAMIDDGTRCLNAGCNDYITKPLKTVELLSKMGAFLNS